MAYWSARSVRLAPVFAAILASPVATLAQRPSLEHVLARAASYLDAYGRSVSGIVGQEDYRQEVRFAVPKAGPPAMPIGERSRRLISDFSFVSDSREGWVELRDVQSVNGQSVAQPDRVVELLSQPQPTALAQARRIVEYGARFNLSAPMANVNRTINLPMAAVLFLKAVHQKRSSFSLVGTERIDGFTVVVIQFEETTVPRLIASDSGKAASGRFWVEPETGAVLQSELKFTTANRSNETHATVRVRYAKEQRLKLWLPAWMSDEYETSQGNETVILSCRATYGSYRSFDVAVDEAFREAPAEN